MIFTFILKNDRTKIYRLISQLMVLLNLAGFIFFLIYSPENMKKNLWVYLAIFSTAVYSVFAFVERLMKKPMPDFWHRTVLAYCAFAWLRTELWWLSIILFLFIGLDFLALRKQVVKVTEKEISLPALIERKVEWNELSNLVLKDGLLTVDLKNNKLFQENILNSDWDIDEEQFNNFCKEQLKKSELYKYN